MLFLKYGKNGEKENNINRKVEEVFSMAGNKNGNGAFLFGAIVGGIVGAATTVFLSSEKGKKLLQEIKNTDIDELKTTAIEWMKLAKDKTADLAKSPIAVKNERNVKNEVLDERMDDSSEAMSIPIPTHYESNEGNKINIEKMLKEAEEALNDAENKFNQH
jgi:gas vesicle protein